MAGLQSQLEEVEQTNATLRTELEENRAHLQSITAQHTQQVSHVIARRPRPARRLIG